MRRLLLTAILLVLASCAPPPKPAPMPAPRPVPTYIPAPPLPVQPASSDWRDWALTPGDWRYVPTSGGSGATFGANALSISCARASRRISIVAPGRAGTMTIRTTALSRSLPALTIERRVGGPVTTADVAANDPLLDAIAFSRGRFIVALGGQPPLVIPAYAEIGRVIEDCRG